MTTMASISDHPGTDVVVASGGELDAVQADLRAARHPAADYDAHRHSAATLRYEQFHTAEPDAMRQFFAGAYRPGWRVTELSGRQALTHRRSDTGSIVVDEVVVQGRLCFDIPPADTVVVIQPRAGSLTVSGARFPDLDGPLLVAHGMSCALRVSGARFEVVTIAAEALHDVAASRQPPMSQPIRFLSWRPRSHGAVCAWHRALDYVTATLAAADTGHQPLIVAALASLVAGALLECYPSNFTDQDLPSDPALPDTLKDAVAFIHHHDADTNINDIAAAVHLTPRAVQYLFRRRLDTTPTEYMRRLRLHRAHQQLVAGDRSNTTVTEIAQRWGFAHTGRFAVLYRQTYGQSPHTTLRQGAVTHSTGASTGPRRIGR
ncbi:MAG: helix-turn-helix transcriptional regulator [Mycobacterium sp.]|nr:helix-turn-helix transcriptional regulator [Mycobacterium sp.]